MKATYLKLLLLAAGATAASFALVSVLTDSPVRGSQTRYHAVVRDASLLSEDDPVRISGVAVGKVRQLRLLPDETVRIDFTVKESIPLPADVHAEIRYKNLIGDRFLNLRNPKPGRLTTSPLPAGATIPTSRTDPALDLDALTGGFRPLLQGLDPAAVNTLSANLLAVIQGEGGSVQQMLQAFANVTDAIADHGHEVDQLVSNLSAVMSTAAEHSDELADLIDRLQRLVERANDEKESIFVAVRHVDEFSRALAPLLKDSRQPLEETIGSVEEVARSLNKNERIVTTWLRDWGPAYQGVAGIGVYGDFFNFFVCDIRVKATGPDGRPVYTPWQESPDERCDDKVGNR